MGALDLQHGQVEVRLRALDHGGELAAVLQMDHDLVATGDDVGVGQHQAAFAVHDDAGAEAHAFLPAGLVEARAETEKLVHGRDALAFHHMGAGDVDDGGGRGLDGAYHRGHARAGIRHGRGGRGRGRTEQGQTGQGACGAAQAGEQGKRRMHGQLRDRCGWKKRTGRPRGRGAAAVDGRRRCPAFVRAGRGPRGHSRQDPPFLIQAVTQVKTGHACAGPGKTLHRKHETSSRIS